MTPQAAMLELLARVGASDGAAVLVSDYELNQWPAAAVKAMKSQSLLVRASPANSVVCLGCERECVMPVHTLPAGPRGPRLFVMCDKPEDLGRVPIEAERLTQWKCDTDAVCGFIAQSLELRRSGQRADVAGMLNIGISTGKKRSQMLCLKADGELALVAGNNAVPLAELVRFHNGVYSMDGTLIRQMVDSASTADNRYTPSNTKREARKLDTQAMYESWKKAYRASTKMRPDMSDVWHSRQIAGMEIGKGSSAETIRKHMKP